MTVQCLELKATSVDYQQHMTVLGWSEANGGAGKATSDSKEIRTADEGF
jgi:hypothetical protein